MTTRGGCWLVATAALPARSKTQQGAARAFDRWVVGSGFEQVVKGTYRKWIPSRARVPAVLASLRAALPPGGSLVAVEVSDAEARRGVTISHGAPQNWPSAPETLIVLE